MAPAADLACPATGYGPAVWVIKMANWAPVRATAIALLALLVSAPMASAIGSEAIESANRASSLKERVPDIRNEATTCARSAGSACGDAASTWIARVGSVFEPLRTALGRVAGGDVDGEVARDQATVESQSASIVSMWTTWISGRVEYVQEWLRG